MTLQPSSFKILVNLSFTRLGWLIMGCSLMWGLQIARFVQPNVQIPKKFDISAWKMNILSISAVNKRDLLLSFARWKPILHFQNVCITWASHRALRHQQRFAHLACCCFDPSCGALCSKRPPLVWLDDSFYVLCQTNALMFTLSLWMSHTACFSAVTSCNILRGQTSKRIFFSNWYFIIDPSV